MKADPFHSHLDGCERCRRQPFNLCQTGAQLLAVAATGPERRIMPACPDCKSEEIVSIGASHMRCLFCKYEGDRRYFRPRARASSGR